MGFAMTPKIHIKDTIEDNTMPLTMAVAYDGHPVSHYEFYAGPAPVKYMPTQSITLKNSQGNSIPGENTNLPANTVLTYALSSTQCNVLDPRMEINVGGLGPGDYVQMQDGYITLKLQAGSSVGITLVFDGAFDNLYSFKAAGTSTTLAPLTGTPTLTLQDDNGETIPTDVSNVPLEISYFVQTTNFNANDRRLILSVSGLKDSCSVERQLTDGQIDFEFAPSVTFWMQFCLEPNEYDAYYFNYTLHAIDGPNPGPEPNPDFDGPQPIANFLTFINSVTGEFTSQVNYQMTTTTLDKIYISIPANVVTVEYTVGSDYSNEIINPLDNGAYLQLSISATGIMNLSDDIVANLQSAVASFLFYESDPSA
jgi:hypothetical protein